VVFATERMDDNPSWRLLDAGELVHVDADLEHRTATCRSRRAATPAAAQQDQTSR